MPDFIIEDGRALQLPDDHGKATELEVLGSSYTRLDLEAWAGHDAHVFRYENGQRAYVGSVDGILSGAVRPPLEPSSTVRKGEP